MPYPISHSQRSYKVLGDLTKVYLLEFMFVRTIQSRHHTAKIEFQHDLTLIFQQFHNALARSNPEHIFILEAWITFIYHYFHMVLLLTSVDQFLKRMLRSGLVRRQIHIPNYTITN